MCDYSLQTVRSRPANVSEKLRTQHFNTCTTGFAAPSLRSSGNRTCFW
jgi:hypothetical protein